MRCGPARPAFALALALTLAAVASCRSRPPAPEAPTAPGPAPTGAAVPNALPPPTPPSGWRLPAGVTPTAYRLALAVDPAADHFTGEVEIELAIAAPTRVIWLHAAALTIASASIVAGGATQPATIVDDAAHERIGVVVPTPLAAGPATVTLAYRGEVTDDDAVGVFRQEVEGRTYLFTQFQANYARRAAPCFDEPGWKTPWLVEVTAPAGLVVLGNTAAVRTELVDGRQVVGFAPTAPLPSYLVALAVGPFELVDVGPVGQAAVPTRIATPVGRAAEAAAAARFTPRAVAALEAYLGRPLPLTKLDLVAAPTLFGAMEHPGLVTFAAEILLEDPARPSFAGRRQLRQTVAHELAHQWFGNLVTPAWWDDLWLSEALASWLGERTARAVEGPRRRLARRPDRPRARPGRRRPRRRPAAASPPGRRARRRRQLRRHHLRQGRGDPDHARAPPRRQPVPGRARRVPRGPRRRPRPRRRSGRRADRGRRQRRRHAGRLPRSPGRADRRGRADVRRPTGGGRDP
jgi:alanyl aminopeptidase